MIRTVHDTRNMLHKAAIAPIAWGTIHRSLVFGGSAKAVRKQLVTVTFCGRSVAVHKKIVAPLARVQTRIRLAEKKHGWGMWLAKDVECFNWRNVRGGSTLSHHAHAVAIDIDPKDNPMHSHYDAKMTTTIPVHVIQAFMDEGWTWGGNWNSPVDCMHMQWR